MKLRDKVLLFLAFLLSSMDIFGSVSIGGFNIRLVYFVMGIVIVSALADAVQTKSIQGRISGFIPLLIWTIFLSVFMMTTALYVRSFLYFGWLGLSLLFVLALSHLARTEEDVQVVLKLWLLAAGMVAIFGIIQFVAGLFGLRILIMQAWSEYFVRVNGFCYEPSYFATYLIGPWAVLLALFTQSGKKRLAFPTGIAFVVVTAAIILSTSRMALLFIGGSIGVFCFVEMVRLLRSRFKDLQWRRELVLVAGIAIMLGGAAYMATHWEKVQPFFAGTGIGHENDSSVTIRAGHQKELLDSLLADPFIGAGMGGIPEMIALQQGEIVESFEDAKRFEGTNVFAEVMVASGFVGFLFFLTFFLLLLWRLMDQGIQLERLGQSRSGIIRIGFFLGLVLTFLFLVANQNILRPYVWTLIAACNAALFVSKKNDCAGGCHEAGN